MNRVFVVGASVVDVILKSSSFKVVKSHQIETGIGICEVLGGKLDAEQGVVSAGGGGSNVAVGLRRLGQSVKVISKVGSDVFGSMVQDDFRKEIVDISHLSIDSGQTGFSSVLVSKDGSRSIITMRGLSGDIKHGDIDWEMLVRADWVQISSLGGNVELFADIVNFCFEKGVRVGVNPGKSELVDSSVVDALKKVYYLNLNRQEASELMKVNFDDEREILRSMTTLGPKIITITDGSRGSSMLVDGRWLKMQTIKQMSVDDTGAGDAFVCGVVYGCLTSKSYSDALRCGNFNGSSVVSCLGAKEGLLRQNEMEKRIKRKLKMTEEVL